MPPMAAPKEDLLAKNAKVYEFLKKVRESKTVSLKPTSMLRSEIVGLDGTVQPFRVRYYQVQAIYHLLAMKRMVLGDATGTGKTLELIGALCYTWEREPNNKVVVVCPKSALRQWQSEIEKFSVGIKTFLVDGSPAERKQVYEDFHAHPTKHDGPKAVMLIGYAPLARDWNAGSTRPLLGNGQPDMKLPPNPGLLNGTLGSIPNLTVTYDECFEYHTPVTLADGTNRLIGKIVCGKEPVSVLSWNWTTQTLESDRVVRWLRNPLRKNKGLVKVSFKYANSILATRDHQLYRLDGKATRIYNLKAGHETAHFSALIPSEDQLQIILGGLLGDASVSGPERTRWGVQFVQGAAQLDYLQFKRGALTTLGVSAEDTTPSGYGGSLIHRFRLNANSFLCSRVTTHEDGKKKPSIVWLDLVGPLGLAIWYADDGSIQTRTNADGTVRYAITLNTQGFSKSVNELLAGWLRWKWGVRARVSISGSSRPTLYLNHDAATRFLALLPGGFPSVMYKFPGKTELTVDALDTKPRAGLVRDTIVSIVPWKRVQKQREHTDYVYDLEVEGNHNYIANGTLVSNCTAFKNTKTKIWQVASELSAHAHRCYGLTATLLKNNLIEGFSIFNVIYPGVFTTKTRFLNDYCVTKLQSVGGGRKIPIIVGYKNLDGFRSRIDPFFLGRPKHVISDELPKLITREVIVELSAVEDTKYEEALSGVLSLGDGEIRDYEEYKKLVALSYCQRTVDSLALLKFQQGDVVDVDMFHQEQVEYTGISAKEQALLDLLSEEFEDEKVIVYTRSASHVPRLQELCEGIKIKSVAVTGKIVDTQKNPARTKAQEAFQDLKSDVRVIFITDAGSEAINLQAASAMIFYNSPWSWGNYVQLLGRPIRIGSPHQHVVAVHLVAERPRTKAKERRTIDRYTLDILAKKKTLIDKVLGEAAVGALDFEGEGSFTKELMAQLRKRDKPEPALV